MQRGFSTLEIMIAFALMALVLSAVILADFGAQYWTITSQTANEALYQAKTTLEDLRAGAKANFQSAVSSPIRQIHDSSCDSGGLCYYVQTLLTDISPCSKYAEADVSWQVQGYPTTTASLFTTFANSKEAVKLGADCGLNWPSGDWAKPTAKTTTLSGNPTGVDVLNGVTYIAESTNPYLEVVTSSGSAAYRSPDSVAFNAIDVARDLATGRTYAYMAVASSTQFQVIDVSDPTTPTYVAGRSLIGMSTSSPPVGNRIAFYDRSVYLTTPIAAGPELHIFDAGYPTVPVEVGTGFELGHTAYGIQVRDQVVGGSVRRYAYLAVGSNDPNELQVLDVTDSKHISQTALCALPGSYKATVVFFLGNTLYLGRDQVPSGDPDFYTFNATDPTTATFCTSQGSVNVDGSFSMHVTGIRSAGPFLFIAATNTTNAHGEIQIRSIDASTNFKLLGTFSVPTLTDDGIDFDNGTNSLSVINGGGSPALQTLSPAP